MTAAAAATHTGLVRSGNEDTIVADAALGLFAVADGMGGHNGGEVASRIVIDNLVEFTRASGNDPSITWPVGYNPTVSLESNQLTTAIQLAHRRIRAQAAAQPALAGMGSTIIAMLCKPDGGWFANVGDSRLYLWRGGRLSQISEDDSWAASMRRAGAPESSVRTHHMRHVLTKAVGSSESLDVHALHLAFEPDDVLLLCSDGLHGPVGDDGLAAVLASAGDDLDTTAQALIDAANAAGGPDNISVILIRPDAPPAH